MNIMLDWDHWRPSWTVGVQIKQHFWMSHFTIPCITLWFNYVPTTLNPYLGCNTILQDRLTKVTLGHQLQVSWIILHLIRHQHNAPSWFLFQPGDLKWPVAFMLTFPVGGNQCSKGHFTEKRGSIHKLWNRFPGCWAPPTEGTVSSGNFQKFAA